MYKSLNTPIEVLKDALKKVEEKLDTANAQDLPALMTMYHELAVIVGIRQDVQHLKNQKWCAVRRGGQQAIITPEDIIIFDSISKDLLAYCEKIQSIAKL
jgi:phosphohistidine swiveling domain-containing protein